MTGMGYLYRVESDSEVREFDDEFAAKQYQSTLPPGSSRSTVPATTGPYSDHSATEVVTSRPPSPADR